MAMETPQSNNLGRQTIRDHLRALRARILLILTIFFVFFTAGWFFRTELLNLYLRTLRDGLTRVGGEIVLLNIADKLQAHLMTVAFCALILLLPIALVILSGFVMPALYAHEKKIVRWLLACISVLFFGGIAMAYFVIIPFTYDYFLRYSVQEQGLLTKMMISNGLRLSLKHVVSFTQQFLVVFGVIFQTPLLMLLLNRLGLVHADFYKRWRRQLYVLLFALAAILTPPDPVSMILMALPLILLFEGGIIICAVFNRKPKAEVMNE